MTWSVRAPLAGALTLSIALAMALPVYATNLMTAVLALMIILCAVGWPSLLDLPSKRGSGLIMALSGLSALALGYASPLATHVMTYLIISVAAAVFLSFAHEMFRSSRHQLTLSISGTASGALVCSTSVTWLQAWLLAESSGGKTVSLAISLALTTALGMLCLALPAPGRVRIPIAIAATVLSSLGLLAFAAFPWPVIALASVGAALIATASVSVFFLLERVIGAYDPKPFLAMSTAPVALAGILAVLVIRLGLSYFPVALGLTVIPVALGAGA